MLISNHRRIWMDFIRLSLCCHPQKVEGGRAWRSPVVTAARPIDDSGGISRDLARPALISFRCRGPSPHHASPSNETHSRRQDSWTDEILPRAASDSWLRKYPAHVDKRSFSPRAGMDLPNRSPADLGYIFPLLQVGVIGEVTSPQLHFWFSLSPFARPIILSYILPCYLYTSLSSV